MQDQKTSPLLVGEPLKLPNGLTLPNRLIKAAMAENMAKGGLPGSDMMKAYGQWADGGWGAIMTGNVMVDELHTGQKDDVVALDDEAEVLARWRPWANILKRGGAKAIMQISHPGRQSPLGAGKRGLLAKSVAPSPIPLNLGDSFAARLIRLLVFGTPRELSIQEIEDIVEQFVRTAKLAYEAGFDGVELHGAHGYLLSQFLSPKINHRHDVYGATAQGRGKIVTDIIRRIKSSIPKDPSHPFCVGIKLNSTDYQHASAPATALEDMLTQIQLFVDCGLDFLEVSGGTYEDPQMMTRGRETLSPYTSSTEPSDPSKSAASQNAQAPKQSTLDREAFFLTSSQRIRSTFSNLDILVTGGFRSRAAMESALQSGACSLIGLARPAAVCPDFPRRYIFAQTGTTGRDEDASDHREGKLELKPAPVPFVLGLLPTKNVVGGGAETTYYRNQIVRMGNGQELSPPP